jgi:hypothetical protein
MDGAPELFIKQNILHCLGAIGIKPNGEFSHITGAFVRIQYLVKLSSIGAYLPP